MDILLNSLYKCFEKFKDVILYGMKNIINLNEIQTVMRSKKNSITKNMKIYDSGEGLSIFNGKRGDTGKSKSKYFYRSKSIFYQL